MVAMEDVKSGFPFHALGLLLFSVLLLLLPLAGELWPSLVWGDTIKGASSLEGGDAGQHAGPEAAAEPGILDLRQMGDSVIFLEGSWRWRPETALPWQELKLPAEISGFTGRGSLGVTLLLPPGQGLYGLKIPYFGSAWKLSINGKEVAGSGSIDPYHPQYLPREVIFSAPEGKTELLFHIANEHHRRVRLTRLYFGPEEKIRQLTTGRIVKDAILFGSLLLLALYHLLLFLAWREESTFLHFGIIAILTALRVGMLSERILVRLWPAMPAELMMKGGYLPAFLLLPFFLYYLLRLTGIREPVPVARGLRLVILGFSVLVLLFPLKVYDFAFTITIIPMAISGLLGVAFISFRYRYGSRVGAMLLLAGGLVIFLAAVNDYLREIGLIQTGEMVSLGILFFLLLQAFFLSWRLKQSRDETVRLAGEVELLNEQLELRIRQRTGELEMANRQLETLSRIDGLTGIPNRRYFDEMLTSEWKRCEREGRPISLIMADVDFFKDYNDNYGHPAGDEALKRIASALQENLLRGTDFVARYGGEEFVILLPEHSPQRAGQVAEKLRAKVEGAAIVHAYSSAAPVITVSLGVAGLDSIGDSSMEELKQRADQGLYRAKQLGRNRVELFRELIP